MTIVGENLTDTSWVSEISDTINPESDSGLKALILIAKHFDTPSDIKQIWHVHGKTESFYEYSDIIRCALRLGLKAREAKLDFKRIDHAPVPFIITRRETNAKYIVRKVIGDKVEIAIPSLVGHQRIV